MDKNKKQEKQRKQSKTKCTTLNSKPLAIPSHSRDPPSPPRQIMEKARSLSITSKTCLPVTGTARSIFLPDKRQPGHARAQGPPATPPSLTTIQTILRNI